MSTSQGSDGDELENEKVKVFSLTVRLLETIRCFLQENFLIVILQYSNFEEKKEKNY